MSKLSQTALYGEVLTSEQLYRRELAQIPVLTDEQQLNLIERVRLGDAEARSEMICAMLPLLLPLAKHYAWVAFHTEFMDLCQIASLEVLEVLDRALEKDKPFAYLRGAAAVGVVRYLKMRDMLIMQKKHQYDCDPYLVVSLDAPLKKGEDGTLADILVDESFHESVEPCSGQYEALYQGVEALTPFQRVVIERCYGLNGCPQERLVDIDLDLTGKRDPNVRVVTGRKHKALGALRRRLERIA